MNFTININGSSFTADFANPTSIGIPLGTKRNPSCYHTGPPRFTPIKDGDFVGSIAEGGTVNHYEVTLAPHGNGTHTECSGHIFNNRQVIAGTLDKHHFISQLVSLNPTEHREGAFISKAAINQLTLMPEVKALVIRTLPNEATKLARNYSGTNPTYISEDAMQRIVDMGVEHLIVDLPSVDPEIDGGRLLAHKTFWQGARHNRCTITELAYVPNELVDGLYLLNLQILRIALDASPSNPVLYSLKSM